MQGHPRTAYAVLVLLAVSLLFVPIPGSAALRVYESVDGTFTEGPLIHKKQDLAQSFLATADYRIVRIEVMVHDLDFFQPVDPLDLSLQTDAGGVPSSTILATARADGPFGYSWVAFDLSPSVDLVAGATYWIVLEDNNGMDRESGYRWALSPGNPYPDGTYATRGGDWNIKSDGDLLFRNWGFQGPLVTAGLVADSPTAGVSDPLTFTIWFNNTGTASASAVWTNVTLSPYLEYVNDTAASAGGARVGPTSWLFTGVALGPHGFLLGARVREGVFDGLWLDVSLRVEYATDGTVEASEARTTIVVYSPSLTVAKDVTPRFLGPGENLTYSVWVTNAGSRASPWVWVNDTLPAGADYLGNNASALANYTGERWDGTTLRVNLTNLPRGTYRFDIFARARLGLENGTALTNVVTTDYADSRGLVVDRVFATATARINGASIRVNQTADVAATGPGQPVTYFIRYDNRGNALARHVWINDTLPPEVVYVSNTGGGVLVGNVVEFAFTNVSLGDHVVAINVRILDTTPSGVIVRNVADLAYTDSTATLLTPSSAFADVTVVSPRVSTALQAPGDADPGDVWTLTVDVANAGNVAARNAWVNLTTPLELAWLSDTAASYGGVAAGRGWRFSNVAPGTFTFEVRFVVRTGLANGTLLTVRATTEYEDDYGVMRNDPPVLRSVTVVTPAFRVEAILVRSVVNAGESFVFLVGYANTGAGVAGNVWINVTLPEGVEVVSASQPWVATTGLRYTWQLRNVVPGPDELRITLRSASVTSDVTTFLAVQLEYTDANGNPLGSRADRASLLLRAPPIPAQTWGLLILVGAVAALSTFIGYKVYGFGSRDRGQIHQLFLLHRSGLLIKHYSRSLRGDLDSDILAAMIIAMQNFVRESFRFKEGALEEMKYGTYKILLGHGQYAILAAVVSGRYLDRLKTVLREGLERLEEEYGSQLRDWEGVVGEFEGMDEIMDQTLQGRIPARPGNARNNHGRPVHLPPPPPPAK